jgi:hypothetical protein
MWLLFRPKPNTVAPFANNCSHTALPIPLLTPQELKVVAEMTDAVHDTGKPAKAPAKKKPAAKKQQFAKKAPAKKKPASKPAV